MMGLHLTAIRIGSALVALGLTVALFYLGSRPEAVGLFRPPWDKVAHAVLFGILALALWGTSGGKRPLLAVVITLAFGMLDEWRQQFLPGRSIDWVDLVADGIGAVCAVYLGEMLSRSDKAKTRPKIPR